MNIPDFEYLKTLKCGTYLLIKEKYPSFFLLLNEKYPNTTNFAEKVYLYYNNLDSIPICNVCKESPCRFISLNKGYSETCSRSCSCKNPERIVKIKSTKLQRYGDANFTNRKKAKKTCLEKYGVDNPSKSEEILEKIKNTNRSHFGTDYPMQNSEILKKSENTLMQKYGVKRYLETEEGKSIIRKKSIESIKKRDITCLKKYGVKNYTQTKECRDKMKNTCLEKYGVEYYTQSEEYKNYMKDRYDERNEHMFKTKRRNNSFHLSSIENNFKEWLDKNHINYFYQYRSQKYPFNCDFYFPDRDMYLEIQGSWIHGSHPFNESNLKDMETLQKWISKFESGHDFYGGAIFCWTERDPKKRQTAKDNKLNFHEIFSDKIDVVIDKFKKYYY